uniref:NADH-ubiquinone oxidoreductase chain 4L n=2 Tax=Neaxius TaxID=464340 RepID=L0E7H8_9EUCA|nr:NADH dehydrogenase subunit 4L [Neaxius glyptocercus]AEW68319.1 NADH dehydrogenase subunit 4L [Neaxius glyptocercus]AGA56227.1 NADH dehydrogenase subunit 4L [Neaxius acanthus]
MTILSSTGLLFPLVSIFCGLLAFVSNRKHLLNALLSLEFIMLGIFWLMVISLNGLSQEVYLVLFFLTLVACEGSLGLSILVSIVRTHGNDYFSTFNSLQC